MNSFILQSCTSSNIRKENCDYQCLFVFFEKVKEWPTFNSNVYYSKELITPLHNKFILTHLSQLNANYPDSSAFWALLSFSVVSDSVTLTIAHQAPLSMGFSRQEYWSGLPFPSSRDLPDPGAEPTPPAFTALQANSTCWIIGAHSDPDNRYKLSP